jgi:hypothetical protein
VTYSVHWMNKTRVHVVYIDLNDRSLKVTPTIAWNTVGKRQSFLSFMAQHQPLAQITGSFFSLQTSHPIGDLVIGGRIVFRGPVGSALAITSDNQAKMMNIPYNWTYSWPGCESAVQGGIRLVQNGQYAVYPRQQGFRDPGLFRPATRTAVGLDNRNRLLMVAVNKQIYLSDLAAIMMELGCTDAMALDGGTSTGLAYGGEVILMPGRTLTNVLMVVQRPEPPTEPQPQSAPEIQAAEMTPAGGGTVIMPEPTTSIKPPPGRTTTMSAPPDTAPPADKPAPKPSMGELLRHVLRNMLFPFAL